MKEAMTIFRVLPPLPPPPPNPLASYPFLLLISSHDIDIDTRTATSHTQQCSLWMFVAHRKLALTNLKQLPHHLSCLDACWPQFSGPLCLCKSKPVAECIKEATPVPKPLLHLLVCCKQKVHQEALLTISGSSHPIQQLPFVICDIQRCKLLIYVVLTMCTLLAIVNTVMQ